MSVFKGGKSQGNNNMKCSSKVVIRRLILISNSTWAYQVQLKVNGDMRLVTNCNSMLAYQILTVTLYRPATACGRTMYSLRYFTDWHQHVGFPVVNDDTSQTGSSMWAWQILMVTLHRSATACGLTRYGWGHLTDQLPQARAVTPNRRDSQIPRYKDHSAAPLTQGVRQQQGTLIVGCNSDIKRSAHNSTCFVVGSTEEDIGVQ